VGSFAANRFGLFDMGSNLQQWCEDWIDRDRKDRVQRGASCLLSDRTVLLSSYRVHNVPGYRSNHVGFRCVLAPATTQP
jgi:formylglycine-generating enzyme required for sulfatase activity